MLTTFILLAMAQTSSVDFAKVLDIDGDGVIHPMEAADAIQMFVQAHSSLAGSGSSSEQSSLASQNESTLNNWLAVG